MGVLPTVFSAPRAGSDHMAAKRSGAPCQDAQKDIIAFLESGEAFDSREIPRRIDTHCASIFLEADRAWKIKRAVTFGYLDFSTPQRRRDALETELRLNRRTAPQLYRAVHPISQSPDGHLEIGGLGDSIDWILEMQRFPDDALLNEKAVHGHLDERMLMALADQITAFHAAAEVFAADTGSARFRSVVQGNVDSMASCPDILDPEQSSLLGKQLLDLTAEMASLLDARGARGRVRHAHGDLHLANIALIEDRPTLFDCLEFSTELATIDVLYDLAFLLMDLWHRNLRTEANLVFNRYLDVSGEDEGGIALMPLFLSVRAAIRAHVLAAQAMRAGAERSTVDNARSYLDLALALLRPARPRLVAIGGLSGTGKSSLARVLGGGIGRAPGARILRNDVLRKRLAGLPPEERLPRGSYSDRAAELVYDCADKLGLAALSCGQSVVVDAVFAQRSHRIGIEAVAERADVPFSGLWLEAASDTRLRRVEGRGADASDADAAVAKAQGDLTIGDLGQWQCISATGPLREMAATARRILGSRTHEV
ncbi:AAA family ATPase [Novosphingobium pentaromativorans]|uniref:bifunctional aminoglycoside phosphotransferase/ATP-binding protein n=1 Tax=Novosphingobium pentaromativorans TaxID=205844 RepID=UPI001EEF9C04|nr:AAA family ATPase [Novosphingobium pentaromativorans]